MQWVLFISIIALSTFGLFMLIRWMIKQDKKTDTQMKSYLEKQSIKKGKSKQAAKKEAERKFDEIRRQRSRNDWTTFAEIAIAVPIVMILMFMGVPTFICYAIGLVVATFIIRKYNKNK